jgi:acetolactate synthase-1/2/3 large subunit
MHLVAALDSVPGMRAVLGLFEGVCTGAADGYGRMTGKPAMTLLHLGPGLANGLANLHNARRARTPVVNVIGDHASWHVEADAPLTSDIVSLASPVSGWVHTSTAAADLADDVARSVAAALGPPGSVASLIVPADCAWDEVEVFESPTVEVAPVPVDETAVRAAADACRAGASTLLYLGGAAMAPGGVVAAARIAASTGCRVRRETFVARQERGAGLPELPGVPYFPEMAISELADVERLVLAGAPEPVAFFGYRDGSSRVIGDRTTRQQLTPLDGDPVAALEALADEVGAGPWTAPDVAAPERPSGALDIMSLGHAVASLQPEGAIVVDESATSGLAYADAAAGAPPHTVLQLTGGAIGQGLPVAVGAALACPDRKVVAFQADGSAMYTLQALWTMAREGLDVTVVLCANHKYSILQFELFRAGITEPGPQARALTDLGSPELDFTALASGLGVAASRAATADQLVAQLQEALASPGPQLIEAVLD